MSNVRKVVTMKSYDDIRTREAEESLDVTETVIPPEDIVAFNESRSCADLYRLYDKNQLDIKPDFQRGIVWKTKEQSLFIDSLIKQLPIPSLCISLDVKSQKRLVIDGLQRIWSIIRFLQYEKIDWTLSESNDLDPRISGRRVSYIHEEEPILFDKLENLTIPITVIRCDYSKPMHMNYLFQIFRRLNSGGSKLLNQEIRNCIFQGKFNDLLHVLAYNVKWLNVNKTTKDIVEKSRFGNEERILRFFAMYERWESYKGNLSGFLNEFMDENKNVSSDKITKWEKLFLRVLGVVEQLELRDDIRKNKNLFEGVLVGIGVNIDAVEHLAIEELRERFGRLLKTRPYAEDIREGMAHTVKVRERMEAAISAFGE